MRNSDQDKVDIKRSEMTKIEKIVKDISDLRDFYIKIKKIKKTGTKQGKKQNKSR